MNGLHDIGRPDPRPLPPVPRPIGPLAVVALVATTVLGSFGLLGLLGCLLLPYLAMPWPVPGPDKPKGPPHSQGPTVVQLQRLQNLVSAHIHVSDIMVAESTWLKGSWIVVGDALLGVDMSQATIADSDEARKTATIAVPAPVVMSPRLDHEHTREWDIKGQSWIPLTKELLGDKEAMRRDIMQHAQKLVEKLAAKNEYRDAAKRSFEQSIRTFYSQVGWDVAVVWR